MLCTRVPLGAIFVLVSCGRTVSSSNQEPTAGPTSNATGGDASVVGSDSEEDFDADTVDDVAPSGDDAGRMHPALGHWALVGFEDPIGIYVSGVSAEEVSGSGCVAWPNYGCTDLYAGSISASELTFRLSGGSGGYWATAIVSENGDRMTGRILFHPSEEPAPTDARPGVNVAWLRMTEQGESDRFLPTDVNAFAGLPGRVTVKLVSGPDVGEFSYEEEYVVWFSRGTMAGGLGAFHESEMTFPERAGDPILIGPVPPTALGAPVEMVIWFREGQPDDVSGFWARTTSESEYQFEVVR